MVANNRFAYALHPYRELIGKAYQKGITTKKNVHNTAYFCKLLGRIKHSPLTAGISPVLMGKIQRSSFMPPGLLC